MWEVEILKQKQERDPRALHTKWEQKLDILFNHVGVFALRLQHIHIETNKPIPKFQHDIVLNVCYFMGVSNVISLLFSHI